MKIIILYILFTVSVFAQNPFWELAVLFGDDRLNYSSIPDLSIDINPLPANVTKDANNKITLINDVAGTNQSFAQADTSKSPVWTGNYVNGQPAIFFDGVGDYMVESTNASFTQPSTVFVVIKRDLITAGNRCIMDGGGSTTRNLLGYTQTNGYLQAYAGSLMAGNTNTNTNWVVVMARFNNASSEISVNDVSYKTGTVGTQTLTTIYLGSEYSPSAGKYLSGYIARFLLYHRALTADEITKIFKQLKTDYAIQ